MADVLGIPVEQAVDSMDVLKSSIENVIKTLTDLAKESTKLGNSFI